MNINKHWENVDRLAEVIERGLLPKYKIKWWDKIKIWWILRTVKWVKPGPRA